MARKLKKARLLQPGDIVNLPLTVEQVVITNAEVQITVTDGNTLSFAPDAKVDTGVDDTTTDTPDA